MTAQQLKNAILQEAIQGHLVPQDPNDEPASVLLDKIRKEKQQLVKEGKLKKKDLEEKPISEDEIPFEIPESWEWCRIAQIIHSPKYGTSNKSLRSGSVPVLRMGNIQDGEIVFDNLVYSNNEDDNKKYNLEKGDLLFNRTNSAELVGKTGIYRGQQRAIFAGYIILLRPILIDSEYLNYVLGSNYARSYCMEVKTIGVQQCNINAEKISSFILPLPPLAEQKRIVAKIEELLPKVEEYGKAQEKLNKLNEKLPERLKKSILQEAIEGRLVPQDPNDEPASALLAKIREEKKQLVKEGKLKKKDLVEKPISEDEIPFEIPDSWEWVRISDVVNVLMGQSPDGNDVFEAKEGDKAYEFHQGKICFTEKYITPSGKWCKIPSRIANKDSLLICVRAPIGDVNITQRSIGIGRGLAAMEGMGNISNMFLFYWMLAHKRCLEDQGTGSTFKAITVEVLKNQKIPLPPLAEQKRIVAKIEEVFKEIDMLKK